MYNTLTNFVNSPEYLMLSSQERNIIEVELMEKENISKEEQK